MNFAETMLKRTGVCYDILGGAMEARVFFKDKVLVWTNPMVIRVNQKGIVSYSISGEPEKTEVMENGRSE